MHVLPVDVSMFAVGVTRFTVFPATRDMSCAVRSAFAATFSFIVFVLSSYDCVAFILTCGDVSSNDCPAVSFMFGDVT